MWHNPCNWRFSYFYMHQTRNVTRNVVVFFLLRALSLCAFDFLLINFSCGFFPTALKIHQPLCMNVDGTLYTLASNRDSCDVINVCTKRNAKSEIFIWFCLFFSSVGRTRFYDEMLPFVCVIKIDKITTFGLNFIGQRKINTEKLGIKSTKHRTSNFFGEEKGAMYIRCDNRRNKILLVKWKYIWCIVKLDWIFNISATLYRQNIDRKWILRWLRLITIHHRKVKA